MVSRNQSRQAPKGTYTHECYTQRKRLVQNVWASENWRGDLSYQGAYFCFKHRDRLCLVLHMDTLGRHESCKGNQLATLVPTAWVSDGNVCKIHQRRHRLLQKASKWPGNLG
ncbi:hypothetical protein MY1884_003507 [Beauveria asiatica]